MINKLTIQNYRNIKSLELNELNAINIFVGQNGSGKSSVLEALALLSVGDPRMHEFLGKWREMPSAPKILRTIFHKQLYDQSIIVSAEGDDASLLEIQPLNYNEARKTISNNPIAEKEQEDQILTYPEFYGIKHLLKQRKGEEWEVEATWNCALHGNHLHFSSPDAPPVVMGCFFIHTRRTTSIKESAEMLTQIANTETEKKLWAILQTIKPDLLRLRVGYENNQVDVLADLVGGETLPMTVLGDGFCRVVLMFTPILNSRIKNKLILIDEIDSGLHYSIMETVWRGMLELVQQTDKQIFCTTHSDEMLEATLNAFADHQEMLRIYRLSRYAGELKVQPFDYELYRNTVLSGFEIRGGVAR